MKLIETPFMVGEDQIGTVKRYADIYPELASPQPRDRVLPAPYFYETRMYFSLIKQREPGEPGWPRGGYEVRDEGGASRCFDLDQVILHPSVIKHRRTLNMMNGGKRGRPSLTSEMISSRADQKALVKARTGGRRGRPKTNRR